MKSGRHLTRTSLQVGLIAASAFALASCSTVTYGTGVGTTAQTVQDMTRMLTLFNPSERILYEERPGLETPQTTTLPPPIEGAPTQTDVAPRQVAVTVPTNCNVGPQLTTPPPGYCTPDPAAPIAGTNTATGIRVLANPCQWWTLSWGEMGVDEREEWAKLGWDATNWASANTDLWPNSAGKLWDDLRLRERRGAEALGFTPATWDACYLV